LKAQLEALTSERNEKVVAVLTAEQRATVEKLKAEAAAKRAAARAKGGSK
jgi:Spy/CpxP family protein refolding chaperone